MAGRARMQHCWAGDIKGYRGRKRTRELLLASSGRLPRADAKARLAVGNLEGES